jgi:hypothetical protein
LDVIDLFLQIFPFFLDSSGLCLQLLLLTGLRFLSLFVGLFLKMPVSTLAGVLHHAVILLPFLVVAALVVRKLLDGLHILDIFGWLGIRIALDAIGIRPRIDGIGNNGAAKQEKPGGQTVDDYPMHAHIMMRKQGFSPAARVAGEPTVTERGVFAKT